LNFWNSISGMIMVEITSADPVALFEILSKARIPLFCVLQKTELVYQFSICRRDYKKIDRIIKKRSDSMRVIHRHGLYWHITAWKNRWILTGTFLILLGMSFILPSRILFIEVSGNQNLSTREILEAAEDCGIFFAASRKHVRSENVKNELLSALPQLQWAGINTAGCRAVISVRERNIQRDYIDENIVTNMIAEQDAYILSVTATKGTAMVQPGDTVIKGQVLISGYTDCGLYIEASRASGEVLAQTKRSITAIMPDIQHILSNINDTQYRISLLVGKKRINLWKDSRISDGVCGRMYKEYFISLPGGFQLPVALCIDRYTFYESEDTVIPETDALKLLQQFSEDQLIRMMIAGQILLKQHHLNSSEGRYMLTSIYSCTEIIGLESREQIGEQNGKGN